MTSCHKTSLNYRKLQSGITDSFIFGAAGNSEEKKIELIRQYNHQECLIYADPPYLKSTRSKRLYFKEMLDEDEHIKLLETLLQHKGSVVISGYDSDLYNSMLKNWKCFIFQERNNNGNKCVEKLWIKE